MNWVLDPALKPLKGMPLRVFDHIDIDPDDPDGCWLWTGTQNAQHGYAQTMGPDGRLIAVHRWVLQVTQGPAPSPVHQAGHACHDAAAHRGECWVSPIIACPHRLCVQPRHLVWQTPRQNLLASPFTMASRNARSIPAHLSTEVTWLTDRGWASEEEMNFYLGLAVA